MAKRQGLRLNLPGAPLTAHTVPGVPGFYRSDVPTPVGGDGELSLDAAKELDKDAGVPLELVDVKNVKEAEKQVADDLQAARDGIAFARKSEPQGAEVQRVKDEQDAVKGAVSNA